MILAAEVNKLAMWAKIVAGSQAEETQALVFYHFAWLLGRSQFLSLAKKTLFNTEGAHVAMNDGSGLSNREKEKKD